jgi:hypothetical protein
MNYLIGSIKHCGRDKVYTWAKSASIHCSAKIVLLCLDEVVPEDLLDLESLGVQILHMPTEPQADINISKFERHFISRKYLSSVEDDAIVLLTDTLDVAFQSDPFEWYRENKTNKVLLTSEGILHRNESWNMRGISNAFQPFSREIETQDVINSGIIMGEVKYVKDILLFIYGLTINVKPEHTEGIDQPALNVAMLTNVLKDITQITTTSESFAVNCAVAGPTPQFEQWGFKQNYKYDLPKFENGLVVGKDNKPYCLVHQYNRVHEWNDHFKAKYKFKPYIKPSENTAVVVCRQSTSYYADDWHKAFIKNNHDYLLCNAKLDDQFDVRSVLDYVQDNVILYSTENIRNTFNFHIESSDKHWWNIGGGRNIIWFYPHFRMMYFYKIHPEYEYYWFFDEDVTFPEDHLYDIVNTHNNLDHDCMITYLFSDINNENPSQVPVVDENMVSYHSLNHYWLSHYPGPGDVQPEDVKEKYGSYFPIVRLSNKALKTLVEEHEKGFYGYSEGYVPTILNHRGLKLYSIFNKESKIAADESLVAFHRRYLELQWKNL